MRDKGNGIKGYAWSYALEAERKMGEMLKKTERARGGNPNLPTGNKVLPVEPTLSELGLTKRESAEAKILASIPRETFEEKKGWEKFSPASKEGK